MIHLALLATQLRAGPIALGTSRASVVRVLGSGTLVRDCDRTAYPQGCPVALRYTDGIATLVVTFLDGDVRALDVTFASPPATTATVPKTIGKFSAWKWEGHTLGSFPPRTVVGWSVDQYANARSCAAYYRRGPVKDGEEAIVAYRCAKDSSQVRTFSLGLGDP